MSTTQAIPKEPWNIPRNDHGRRIEGYSTGTIEYEPTIMIDGVEIPERDRAEFVRRRDEAKKKAENLMRKEQPQKKTKKCPFREGIDTSCELEKCALFLDGCALSRIGGTPEKDTRGKKCPLNVYKKPCSSECALYKNGCSLAAAAKRQGGGETVGFDNRSNEECP